MDWFGLTLYGVPEIFSDLCKSDYIEPNKQRNLLKDYKPVVNRISLIGKVPFENLIKSIDVYITQVDGYAYKSYDRLIKSRIKGRFKAKGPSEMYVRTVTNAMEYGWFLSDPELENKTWYRTPSVYLD